MPRILPVIANLVVFLLALASGPLCSARGEELGGDDRPIIVKTQALLGEPFGLGVVSFRLPHQVFGGADPNLILRTGAVRVTERDGRIFYPAYGLSPVARFFNTVFNRTSKPGNELISVWFLFRGNQPLQLKVQGVGEINVTVTPTLTRRRELDRMLKQWWREYQASNFTNDSDGDFPDLVHVYLGEMLSHRLGLSHPARERPSNDPLAKTIELLTDIDPLNPSVLGAWFDGQQGFDPPQFPLPQPMQWTPVVVTNLPEEIPIEPIVYQIPHDCFYLRFGTWDNQIWLKKLIEEHGGDLGRMIRLRGFEPKVQQKFLTQLALESSQIDQWFGGNLISDVAVIGRDTYFETGPSVGVVLQSKDSKALSTRIERRRQTFASERQINLGTVEVAGQTVSYLSSLDNRYRSFYVVRGDSHLFTNSRAIAESFIKCRDDKTSLGDSPEFRYLRTQMALDRNDTIFVYFSTEFFKKILEPQYQIELYRRSQTLAEMQVYRLASLAAAREGFPNAPLDFLIGNRFLPPILEQRIRESQIRIENDVWIDGSRGQRGYFLPIADTSIGMVSAAEQAWYLERARFFVENVRQLDPMVIAIQRFNQDPRIERIVFDARLAPFGQDRYNWLTSMLGPPMPFEVVGNDRELIRGQLSIKGGVWNRNVPQHQLFAAISGDEPINLDLTPTSFFESWRTLKEVPGYLGAWPKPGTLDWLPMLGGRPDEQGYSYSRLLDLWRLQFDDFSVLSFQKHRLEGLRGNLRVVPTDRPVQLKITIGDLAKSQLNNWANVLNYRRAWETSIANIQLLNLISDQFGVEAGEAKRLAQELFDVQLVCSLGGEYRLQKCGAREIWVSTAWPNFTAPVIPQEYTSPLLNWFRGCEVVGLEWGKQYSLHGYLDIERSASTGATLPSIDLFKGFQNLFPGSGKNLDDKQQKRP